MVEATQHGEFRNLTTQEIARVVTMLRQTLGLKQLALALEAGIDERTVQRIEGGEKVSDDTLRRIAKVLRIKDGTLIGPRYVSTPEQAVAKVEKVLSEMLTVEARDFISFKNCQEILGKHGYIVTTNTSGKNRRTRLRDLEIC